MTPYEQGRQREAAFKLAELRRRAEGISSLASNPDRLERERQQDNPTRAEWHRGRAALLRAVVEFIEAEMAVERPEAGQLDLLGGVA